MEIFCLGILLFSNNAILFILLLSKWEVNFTEKKILNNIYKLDFKIPLIIKESTSVFE